MSAPARMDGPSTKDRIPVKASTTVEQPEKLAPAERPRRTRSAAAERAYARRAQREGRRDGTAGTRVRTRPSAEPRREPQAESRPRRQPVARKQASTATFVVLVISMLLVGVATTLWLSTQAIADSYKLDDAKKGVAALSEQAEQLRREVTSMDSASALAKRAQEQGMVPSGDPAYLVVGPDGKVRLVGDPKPVEKPKPPAGTTTSTSTPPPAGHDQNADQHDQHGQDHG
jgi:cell division protein FtsL